MPALWNDAGDRDVMRARYMIRVVRVEYRTGPVPAAVPERPFCMAAQDRHPFLGRDRMDDLIAEQRALNRATAGNRKLFADHRSRLDSLIEGAAAGESLGLVGAGNCNDYDLARLLTQFRRIDLIDLDEEAVTEAVAAIGRGAGLRIRAPVDVGNVGPVVRALREGVPLEGSLLRLSDGSVSTGFGPYDLVVSAGVLTQAMRSVGNAIGEDHPGLGDVAVAVRSGHIRSLLRLARPGGRVLLVTEVVSSQVLPEIDGADDGELGSILFRAIFKGDVFLGVNPAALTAWLTSERPLGARLVQPGIVGPWRWRQSPARTFLMIGFLIERSDAPG
jgi:hypothetical protein